MSDLTTQEKLLAALMLDEAGGQAFLEIAGGCCGKGRLNWALTGFTLLHECVHLMHHSESDAMIIDNLEVSTVDAEERAADAATEGLLIGAPSRRTLPVPATVPSVCQS
jgi:hypothetical protein